MANMNEQSSYYLKCLLNTVSLYNATISGASLAIQQLIHTRLFNGYKIYDLIYIFLFAATTKCCFSNIFHTLQKS